MTQPFDVSIGVLTLVILLAGMAISYLGLLLVWLVPQQLLLRWSHRRARTLAAHNPAHDEAQVFGPRLPWLATGTLVLVWAIVTWIARPVRPLAFATLGLTDYGALAIFCLGWSGVVLFFLALSFWMARDRRIPGTAVAAAILLWGMFLAGTMGWTVPTFGITVPGVRTTLMGGGHP